MVYKTKAILLYSGGLDSTLALHILVSQNVEVIALTFITPFYNYNRESKVFKNIIGTVERLGCRLKTINLQEEYLPILKSPKYGFGSAANPCIDCRILMMKHAKKIMEEEKADFIATGEVLGQRPFSQTITYLKRIDSEADVEGLVLRPLSAKLLPETIPEKLGLVDRERLFGIRGKSRKVQLDLAKSFGITDYPSPAGGCLLTEPAFGRRFNDLKNHNPNFSLKDTILLKFGRHFRINDDTKVIIGRNKEENEEMIKYVEPEDIVFEVVEYKGPVGLYFGRVEESLLLRAASIIVAYSKAPKNTLIKVRFYNKVSFEKILETNAISLEGAHLFLIK
ncbi:MAG: tRNA 4-thiouridine(8) synthase ThiI [Nitrososphaeria archaeon]|nr:tRNA 4-thiouridine(8) synthase ThiI [Nitrososphaeria archaeon]